MVSREEAAAQRKKDDELDLKRKRLREALDLCNEEVNSLDRKWKVIISMSQGVHEIHGCSITIVVKQFVPPSPKRMEHLGKRVAAMYDKLAKHAKRWDLLPFAFTVSDTSKKLLFAWYLDEKGNLL